MSEEASINSVMAPGHIRSIQLGQKYFSSLDSQTGRLMKGCRERDITGTSKELGLHTKIRNVQLRHRMKSIRCSDLALRADTKNNRPYYLGYSAHVEQS